MDQRFGVHRRRPGIVLATLLLLAGPARAQGPEPASGEAKAITYLSREVPAWPREANCFSCHNNGDAARALFLARTLSYNVPDAALEDTVGWLVDPGEWENSPGNPIFSDKKLARIQFAAALAAAIDAGIVADRSPLEEVAETLLKDQEADGSWHVEGDDATIGSPATYGAVLATYMTRKTLEAADAERFSAAISRADKWLLTAPLGPIMDTAALVLGLGDRVVPEARQKVGEALNRLLDSQSGDGGWGPYPKTPSEPFDTALVLLALASLDESWDPQRVGQTISGGRGFLLDTQFADGGWIETTRPSGSQSYAEHISTTAWATLALLRTLPDE